MKQYYSFTVSYNKEMNDEKETVKKITEQYLVSAVNYTDAEKLAHEQMEQLLPNGTTFSINTISKANYDEIIKSGDGIYYKTKCTLTYETEKGTKTETSYTLVMAETVKEAYDIVIEKNENVEGFGIATISETKILDIYEG